MNPDSRFSRWLLFDGDRHLLAAAFLGGVFCILVALGQAGVVALTDSDAVDTIAGGLVPGLFTFLSIVLGINQLVLSQSSGSADQVWDRVAEIREFRTEVEQRSGTSPSPLAPSDFLAVLVDAIADKAEALRSITEAEGNGSPAEAAVADYAEAVTAAADRADRRVQRTDPGRVNAVISLLDYDDSRQLYEARRLLADHGDDLSAEARATIDELVELLELFDVARTHFRTTYTQRTLARLSRILLYVGLPAILATFVLGMSTFPAIGGWRQVVVASLLLTMALAPLAVLSSYILRVAAVSERTVGVGPFVSRPGIEQEFPSGEAPDSSERRDSPAERSENDQDRRRTASDRTDPSASTDEP